MKEGQFKNSLYCLVVSHICCQLTLQKNVRVNERFIQCRTGRFVWLITFERDNAAYFKARLLLCLSFGRIQENYEVSDGKR